jgi:hypothetical protein
MSRFPLWTDGEIKNLREMYPVTGTNMVSAVVNRPVGAIRQKANELGLIADRKGSFYNNWNFINNNPYDKLSNTDLAYIAGLIDGEGWLECRHGSWVLGIGNTNKEVIDWLYAKVVNSRTYYWKSRHLTWKDSWQWKLMGNLKVFALLTLVFPYLIIKRDKVTTTIAEIRTREERFEL